MINDVSDTAFWVANFRAKETDRPDALFHDPLARRLAGDRGRDIAAYMPRSAMTEWSVVVRTVIIDDLLKRAIAGGVDTIVNLGAGLDTRPYRLKLPGALRWIEVDYPQVLNFKASVLANERPRCALERIPLDLSDVKVRSEFLASLNASSERILVLTEGVVPYLTVNAVASLADDLRATPHIKYWIADYYSPQAMKTLSRSSLRAKMRNAPFQFFPPEWFAFFREHGWKPNETRYLAEEGLKLGRSVPLPWFYGLLMRIGSRFASPERRAAARRFTAYVMLEPG